MLQNLFQKTKIIIQKSTQNLAIILMFSLVITGFINHTNNPSILAATVCINSAGASGAVYPDCNKCPTGQVASGDLKTSGSCDPLPPGCGNGANNPPTCDTCPSEMVMVSGTCTVCDNGGCDKHVCINGSTNPPSCGTSCVAGTSYAVGSTCQNYQKAGISYQEFDTKNKNWSTVYTTPNGYNIFKCSDIKNTADPMHLSFDTKNYFGIKEVCAKGIASAMATGIADPKVYYYSFIYKQVNTRTMVAKYYVYTYTSYYNANGDFVNWYSQRNKDNPSSTGWVIYNETGNAI